MNITRFTVLSALLLSGALAGGAETAAPLQLTRNVTRTVLPNGLTVLTKEVHTAPVVSVQVFYKIGSRNEAPGVNGIAHQLEHMLFKGTTDRPVQFGRLLGALGADFNAFTAYDQTGYYATVERGKTNAVLALEADRMRNALINPASLDSEKRVVLSEIEGDENEPGYRLSRAVQAAAFPNSPYGLTVGGTRRDIQGFTADQVRAYYQKYYAPQDATLVVVGDFRTADVLKQVRALFGGLGTPGTAPVAVSDPLVPRPSEATLGSPGGKAPIVLREPGATPLVNAVYPLPDLRSPDAPALRVMDAILFSGRASRLYQSLVQTGLVADAGTYPNQFLRGGWYEVNLTPTAGHTPAEVDAAYLKTVADLQRGAVAADELARAKTAIRTDTILGNVSVTAQAQQLGLDATSANDYQFTDKFLAGVDRVTAADVVRVANTYLRPDRRTVGYFEPTQATQAQGGGGGNAGAATQESFNAGPPVDPAEVAKYLPRFDPPGQVSVALPEEVRLPNGLRVFLLRDTSTPTVFLSGAVRAGREFDTDARAGLADLVAANLLSGTATRSADALANLLDNHGVHLNASPSRYSVNLGGASLAGELPVLVDALADVLQHASFPEQELQLSRARTLQGIAQREDNPSTVAQRVFQQTLYPQGSPFHPYSTAQSVTGLRRADLQEFYRTHYRPDATILTLVGDFDPARVKALLQEKFGGWQAQGPAPTVAYPAAAKPGSVVRLNPTLPGKTQSVVYLGYPAIDRKDPLYYSSLVLNQVLGGDTLASLLGTEVRDRQGLTYGIYSGFQASLHAGPFAVVMQTAPGDAARAVDAALAVIGEVRTRGLTPAEVGTAKNTLLGQYTVSLATPDSLAATFTSNALLGLPLSELTNYQARVNAVTVNDVNRAAQTLLDPGHLLIVTAGPPTGGGK